MADTKISYVDKVWNPVTGCGRACEYCYAAGIARRFWGTRKFSDVQFHEDRLDQPFHWKKPARIFVNSMGDIFDKKVKGAWLDKVLNVIEVTPRHTFLMLTKVPENIPSWIESEQTPNLWVGVTVENYEHMHRITTLMQNWHGKKYVSFEPLIGSVGFVGINGIDWVIVGGMSGHKAVPMQWDWAYNIYRQSVVEKIPFYFKQYGAATVPDDYRNIMEMVNTKETPNGSKA
jgi:protein gp37